MLKAGTYSSYDTCSYHWDKLRYVIQRGCGQLELFRVQVRDLLVLRHLLISLEQTQVCNTERVRAAGPITCARRDLLVLRHLLISLGQTQVDNTERVREAGPITCSSRGPTGTRPMTPAHITGV
jgi:hypothetical protein